MICPVSYSLLMARFTRNSNSLSFHKTMEAISTKATGFHQCWHSVRYCFGKHRLWIGGSKGMKKWTTEKQSRSIGKNHFWKIDNSWQFMENKLYRDCLGDGLPIKDAFWAFRMMLAWAKLMAQKLILGSIRLGYKDVPLGLDIWVWGPQLPTKSFCLRTSLWNPGFGV